MNVEYKQNGNDIIVFLSGELDENSATHCRAQFDALLSKAPKFSNIIVDFLAVNFMDSTGIGVLVGRYKKFDDKNFSFYIRNPSKTIDKILKMTGIYTIMPKSA